jgi:hypothetical protein
MKIVLIIFLGIVAVILAALSPVLLLIWAIFRTIWGFMPQQEESDGKRPEKGQKKKKKNVYSIYSKDEMKQITKNVKKYVN